jgi:hypothetical protein
MSALGIHFMRLDAHSDQIRCDVSSLGLDSVAIVAIRLLTQS